MYRMLVLALALLLICSGAMAGEKIGADLQKRLNSLSRSEQIPVVVLFEGLPSFHEVAQEYRFLGEREIIRNQVIRVMKDKAESLHYWLRQACSSRSLAGQITNFKSIWVANAVSMKATAYAVHEIANQPNVEKVILDEAVPMLLDTKELTWGVKKINAPDVWQYYTGKGVVVAVIDTGVNKHPDLAGRVLDGKNYIKPGTPPRDDHYHGTHCAGTVAGNGKMGTKTGVAPDAKILAIKVLGANGSGQWSNLWNAIEDTISRKTNVLSMSLGGRAGDDVKKRLVAACKNAIDAGVTPVIAAGNSGPRAKTVGSPGDVLDVISVGATDSGDGIARFSSRGPVTWDGKDYIKPDVSAPGVNVKSCNSKNDGYRNLSGTSMATPHVAGAVALMLQANPKLKPQQVKAILEKTAVDLGDKGKDNSFGSGRIDVAKAIKASRSLKNLGRGRWEMVVKEMSFKATIDANGKISVPAQEIPNDMMPGTVTIWVSVREEKYRTGIYAVDFKLTGPTTTTGSMEADYDNIPSDPNKYEAKYGFNCGNFPLEKGTYIGYITPKKPNGKLTNVTLTLDGKATWPARK